MGFGFVGGLFGFCCGWDVWVWGLVVSLVGRIWVGLWFVGWGWVFGLRLFGFVLHGWVVWVGGCGIRWGFFGWLGGWLVVLLAKWGWYNIMVVVFVGFGLGEFSFWVGRV